METRMEVPIWMVKSGRQPGHATRRMETGDDRQIGPLACRRKPGHATRRMETAGALPDGAGVRVGNQVTPRGVWKLHHVGHVEVSLSGRKPGHATRRMETAGASRCFHTPRGV